MKKIKIKYIILFISVSIVVIFSALTASYFGKFNYFWHYSLYTGCYCLFAGIVALIIKVLTLKSVRKTLNS